MGCNNCYVPSSMDFSNVYIREVIKEEIISASDTLKGDSAYEIAVKLGYKGNEEEWLLESGATIESITVTTGLEGTNASATLAGTPKNRRINLTIPRGDKGIQGLRGETGLSNYDIAVSNGFTGTKTEWLATIKGLEGPKGPLGPEGKSTYDLAVAYGFKGSEREWLTGLTNDTELMANLYADFNTIQQTANGNENTDVVTRLGETYPTAKKAVKQIFENGGLPATPFTTKALMIASTLIDDKYAMVTDDTTAANNGLYQKKAGVWVKSSYDPLTQAKSYTDTSKTSAISTAATDATEKANAAKTEAIVAAALDATTKADAAKSAALNYIESLKNIDLLTIYN